METTDNETERLRQRVADLEEEKASLRKQALSLIDLSRQKRHALIMERDQARAELAERDATIAALELKTITQQRTALVIMEERDRARTVIFERDATIRRLREELQARIAACETPGCGLTCTTSGCGIAEALTEQPSPAPEALLSVDRTHTPRSGSRVDEDGSSYPVMECRECGERWPCKGSLQAQIASGIPAPEAERAPDWPTVVAEGDAFEKAERGAAERAVLEAALLSLAMCDYPKCTRLGVWEWSDYTAGVAYACDEHKNKKDFRSGYDHGPIEVDVLRQASNALDATSATEAAEGES